MRRFEVLNRTVSYLDESFIPRLSQMKLVSVVIPFFGSVDQLASCLLALERQTLPPESSEIIVVDNGSDRDLSGLQARHPSVRWIEERRHGSFAARNTGIKIATGEIIAFTDSDCLPTPSWLEKGILALKKDGATIVAGKVDYLNPESRELNMYEQFEEVFFFLNKQKFLVEKLNVAATANIFAFRSVFDHIGDFDTKLMHFADGDWTQRGVRAGEVLQYADDALVRHPRRSTFVEISRKVKRSAGDRMALARKNGRFSRVVLLDFVRWSFIDPRAHVALFRYSRLVRTQRIKVLCFGIWMSLTSTGEKFRVLTGGAAFRG